MKKIFVRAIVPALACAGLAAPASSSLAQGSSSVVLGGVADAGVRHVSNAGLGSIKSLVSGSNSTSRLLFRGSEDLGGGLSAGFHLEHGILLDSGSAAQATQFWDRRATLSLASKTLGEIRAGRDFVPSYVNWSRYDPFGYIGVAGANNFVSATPNGPIRNAFGSSPNTTVRSSNSIQVLLPGGLAGIEGGVMAAAGEGGSAANGQHKVLGARLGWAASGFGVSVARTTTQNNLTAAAGGGKFNDTAVGANAGWGGLRVTAAWRQFKQASAKQTDMLLGLVLPLGSGELKASLHKVDLSGRVGNTVIDANDAKQFGLGYVYNLSRRSALYGTVARIDNDGAATYVVPGGPAGLAGGRASTGVEAGIRHNF